MRDFLTWLKRYGRNPSRFKILSIGGIIRYDTWVNTFEDGYDIWWGNLKIKASLIIHCWWGSHCRNTTIATQEIELKSQINADISHLLQEGSQVVPKTTKIPIYYGRRLEYKMLPRCCKWQTSEESCSFSCIRWWHNRNPWETQIIHHKIF
jgi:hypothetical protein